jgi:hypothetical protein
VRHWLRAWRTPALPGRSVIRALRDDRALAIAFAMLACGALAPLFVTPILPFPDLPSNVACASLLARTALHQASVMPFYRVEWLPFPYWTSYLIVGSSSLLVGPFIASKLLVGIIVLLLPLSLMRLALALGRDARLGLWGFLLSWDHNLHAGWHAFGLGMAIGFVVLAKIVETADDPRAAVRVIPWSILLALTHAMAVLFVALAAPLLVATTRLTIRRARALAIGLSGAAIMGIPWLLGRHPSGPAAWHFDYPTASEKAGGLFGFSVDNLRGSFGEVTAALAFGLLLVAPLAFACTRTTESQAPDDRQRWSGGTIALAALVLYAALPMAIYGPLNHWYTYPRYASYLLALLPFVPPLRKLARGWIVPVIVVALAGNLATARAFAGFATRVRPFLEIADVVPPGARLLPLEFVHEDPAVKLFPLAHLHSYITAKGLYDPHMFDNPDAPIRYRDGLGIPRISWLGPQGFTLARYAPFYDYILVQGLSSDPFQAISAEGGYRVRLVREAGIWRLYQVVRD